MIKPKKLYPGDTIGLISPASPTVDRLDVPRSKEFLEKMGYKVVLGKHVDALRGHYAAALEDAKAEDFNEMFANDEIDMILCVRGGSSTQQFVQRIDFENVRKNPKIFSGFSDITTLHLAIAKHAGLVTFHGPNLMTLRPGMSDYTKDHFFRAITSTEERREIKLADEDKYVMTIHAGAAEAPVLGGNLCLIAGSCGTMYQPDFTGKILFFEETNEQPYAVDRYLAQMRNCGMLDGIKGVLIGEFSGCGPGSAYSTTIIDTFEHYFADLGVPCLYGLPLGHTKDMATLPQNCMVRLDADAKTLEVLESGVTD